MTTTTKLFTLAELADIGAKASAKAIGYDYQASTMACKAFAKAVLDAIGYKLPVDPDRESFDKWWAVNAGKFNLNADIYWPIWKQAREELRTRKGDESFAWMGVDGMKITPSDEAFEKWYSLAQMTPVGKRELAFAAWKAGREQERKEAQIWLDEIEKQKSLRKSKKTFEAHGWIPWSGGECPVAGNIQVQCKCLNGHQETSEARDLDWSHDGGQADIIAYKITPQTTTP